MLSSDDPLPGIAPEVEAYLKPPQQVVTKCAQTLGNMQTVFKLEDVKKDKEKVANVFVKDPG